MIRLIICQTVRRLFEPASHCLTQVWLAKLTHEDAFYAIDEDSNGNTPSRNITPIIPAYNITIILTWRFAIDGGAT